MMTTEVFKLQLDNMQHEMQQLQVENKNLQVKVQLGENIQQKKKNSDRDYLTVKKSSWSRTGKGAVEGRNREI